MICLLKIPIMGGLGVQPRTLFLDQLTTSEVFFEIKTHFFSGYFDPVNKIFDSKNKYCPG